MLRITFRIPKSFSFLNCSFIDSFEMISIASEVSIPVAARVAAILPPLDPDTTESVVRYPAHGAVVRGCNAFEITHACASRYLPLGEI